MKRLLVLLLLPILFAAQSLAQNKVGLAWDASVPAAPTPPNLPCGIIGYNVLRSVINPPIFDVTSKLNAQPVTQGTPTAPFIDSTVLPGITYYYVVTAVGDSNCSKTESDFSNQISYAIATITLSAPTNLKATCSADAKSVTATWDAVTNAEGYLPRIDSQPPGNALFVEPNPITSRSWTRTVAPNVAMQIWVHAYSSKAGVYDPTFGPGVGPYTQVNFTCASATVPPSPTNLRIITPLTGAVIPWNKSTPVQVAASNAKRLYIYLDSSPNYSATTGCTLNTPCTVNFGYRPGQPGGTHFITGMALNSDNVLEKTVITVKATTR